MFAVFGKSLKKEQSRRNLIRTVKFHFKENKGVYQISPDYSDESKCWEFIELAKKTSEIRCLYIARLECYTRKGKYVIDKKTGKKKTKYVVYAELPKD